MKKIINVTICIFTLFSTKVFSQDFDENDFFCCSVYELYKTSTENDVNNIMVENILKKYLEASSLFGIHRQGE